MLRPFIIMDSNHQNSRFCPEVLIDYIIKFSIKKNVNSVSSARNDILHHMIVSISISSMFSIFSRMFWWVFSTTSISFFWKTDSKHRIMFGSIKIYTEKCSLPIVDVLFLSTLICKKKNNLTSSFYSWSQSLL